MSVIKYIPRRRSPSKSIANVKNILQAGQGILWETIVATFAETKFEGITNSVPASQQIAFVQWQILLAFEVCLQWLQWSELANEPLLIKNVFEFYGLCKQQETSEPLLRQAKFSGAPRRPEVEMHDILPRIWNCLTGSLGHATETYLFESSALFRACLLPALSLPSTCRLWTTASGPLIINTKYEIFYEDAQNTNKRILRLS